jgi:lipid II:glycine glycyltransferase (peptidoglycan interpeptide bridge formation enzyme)
VTLTVRRLHAADRASWDALVAANDASGFGQSWAWATFKEREGHQVERLGVFDGARLVAGAMLHLYPSLAGQALLYAPDGPVVPWDDEGLAREALRRILDRAAELARSERAIALRIEPHLERQRGALLREFVRAPLDIYPQHTLLVDLGRDDATLLGAMRPKGRYNVGLAARRGVRVESATTLQDLRRFYPLFEASALRNGFFAEPYGFFINLAQSLFPEGMLRLYLATHDGDDLAAALIVHLGARATYLYGGSADYKRNLMASYAVHWAALRDARDAGLATYDFFGYEPYGLVDHLYAGFSRFKRQFGGRAVRYIGAQDYVFYEPLAEVLAQALVRVDARGAAAES